MKRGVVIDVAGAQSAPAQHRRQLVALHQLAGETVLAQGLNLTAHAFGLLLGDRHAQRTDATHRVAHAERLREVADLMLCRHRAGVDAPVSLATVELAGIVVKRRHAREQEAAVAAARAAGHAAALEHQRLDSMSGQAARAGQAADAAADDARLYLHRSLEGRTRLVGRVEPVGDGAHGSSRSVRAAKAANSPAAIASRIARISSAMNVRLCRVISRLAVSSLARIR